MYILIAIDMCNQDMLHTKACNGSSVKNRHEVWSLGANNK